MFVNPFSTSAEAILIIALDCFIAFFPNGKLTRNMILMTLEYSKAQLHGSLFIQGLWLGSWTAG